MEKEFIPYEQALALKELGFDEPCFAYYNIDPQLKTPAFNIVKPFEHEWCLSAPLYQQAFRWFREKHGLCNFINLNMVGSYGFCSGWEDLGNNEHGFENFKTYEEAELACLIKLIEIVKNK